MGLEAVCRVTYAGQASEGKALLETNEIIFRGGAFRLKIPFREITSLQAGGGDLDVGYNGGVATFELGGAAQTWATKIQSPRGLLDKLGVKPGMIVAVLGVADEGFIAELQDRGVSPTAGLDNDAPADIVFYEADVIDDLVRLPELREAIKPAGAVWVVSPKGKTAVLKDTDVMAAARSSGLVDNKVASFSETHTALRLVIPKADRKTI
jgi:hypothetical protein